MKGAAGSVVAAIAIGFGSVAASGAQGGAPPVGASVGAPKREREVRHRTVEIDGLEIFYREAGPEDAPALLLLHWFPSSSH